MAAGLHTPLSELTLSELTEALTSLEIDLLAAEQLEYRTLHPQFPGIRHPWVPAPDEVTYLENLRIHHAKHKLHVQTRKAEIKAVKMWKRYRCYAEKYPF